MRFILVALSLFVLVALVVGCGSASAPAQPVDENAIATRAVSTFVAQLTASAPRATSAPKPTNAPAPTKARAVIGKIGERVEGGGIALLVNKVSVGKGTSIYKPKGVLLVVDATLENVALDSVSVNPLNFHVRDGSGLQVEAALGGVLPQISLAELAAGEKVRGNIAFDVPSDSKELIFFWDPLFGAPPGLPRISLGR